jgi:hypothetical protein
MEDEQKMLVQKLQVELGRSQSLKELSKETAITFVSYLAH